ncbi:hypothetical protein DFH08DRAFT_1018924 [Mycena albidolilacea]|uniref:Uncharacterized protein n=1 Tax=Mycena albidolilacea TaxID=1033008 RepID=A0AAD6ZS65_9AGAR|nr:hypothetical protein DFH08DRAFT_1018924 [Mycena albidolilacea]
MTWESPLCMGTSRSGGTEQSTNQWAEIRKDRKAGEECKKFDSEQEWQSQTGYRTLISKGVGAARTVLRHEREAARTALSAPGMFGLRQDVCALPIKRQPLKHKLRSQLARSLKQCQHATQKLGILIPPAPECYLAQIEVYDIEERCRLLRGVTDEERNRYDGMKGSKERAKRPVCHRVNSPGNCHYVRSAALAPPPTSSRDPLSAFYIADIADICKKLQPGIAGFRRS